ncbi:unnamed protein product [Haemonchus placei]|uniref:50S ribosomal protein L22e n=1 Tax=Haemonchus placei TaxID=6290 RepID=A0A0N4VSJ7_HAEPC|nr:unnamed protein product [Haemonchus placei]
MGPIYVIREDEWNKPHVIEFMVSPNEIHDNVIKVSLGVVIMQGGAIVERKSIALSVPIPWIRKSNKPVRMRILIPKWTEMVKKNPKIGKRAKTLKKAMAPKAKK